MKILIRGIFAFFIGGTTFAFSSVFPSMALAGTPIAGGHDSNGAILWVCLAKHSNGSIHPGKLFANYCNYGYGGQEIRGTSYSIPTVPNNYAPMWYLPISGIQFPAGSSIPNGIENGYPLPVCQAPYNNGLHIGKFVAGKCNFGYAGREVISSDFRLLILVPIPQPTLIGPLPY